MRSFSCAERGEFGHPGVAELAKVGERIAGERREELLVRGGPRQLLHLHVNLGIAPLELGQQLLDHLGFAPHEPEVQLRAARIAFGASGEQQNQHCEQGGCPA